jgi:hypothetical protein
MPATVYEEFCPAKSEKQSLRTWYKIVISFGLK